LMLHEGILLLGDAFQQVAGGVPKGFERRRLSLLK
jgi:hypothetical protein